MYAHTFELNLLPAPPAGFEPAHTAPEGNAGLSIYQAKCEMSATAREDIGSERRLTTRRRGPWVFKSGEQVEPFAYAGVLSADFHLGGTG